METAGEERVRAGRSLRKLEDMSVLFEQGARATPPTEVSPDFPKHVSEILNDLTTLSSREDAERLLAAGVSMWNSVIALEGQTFSQEAKEAQVKIRHCSVDCIYMASTCLGGISSQFDIQESTLLKFYTACGKKYAEDLEDMEMASVCFSKAQEFGKSAKALVSASPEGTRSLSKAMFDLLLGSAECAWDRNDREAAEGLLSEASEYLQELPGECEYMASVLFNLGLFSYRAKEPEKAISWLLLSLETRALECNPEMSASKQAKTARLVGVCYLALKDFENALKMMEQAEDTFHDPVGAYLLLKLSVMTRSKDIEDRLSGILDDPEATLDICMASISLLVDAQRVGEAIAGFERLFAKHRGDPNSIVRIIGPRHFEALAGLGRVADAIQVMDTCCEDITVLTDGESPQADLTLEIDRWTSLMLYAGSALADRKEFEAAACILDKCLSMTEKFRMPLKGLCQPEEHEKTTKSIVLENEAGVCRLAASCAMCAATEKKALEGDNMDQREKVQNSNEDSRRPDIPTLLDQVMKHALAAKRLDKDDFAPRLLIFRAYLFRKDTARAAVEMREASEDIRSFDAGALAEAACEAKEAGSLDSVLEVLRCILRNSESAATGTSAKGFIGTVLVSALNIRMPKETPDGANLGSQNSQGEAGGDIDSFPTARGDAADMLQVLQDGMASVTKAGIHVAFDEKVPAEPSLAYITDVAWNVGRRAGMEKWYDLWEGLFDVCHDFSLMREQVASVLQTRRVARLMSATALIEMEDENLLSDGYSRASQKLADTKSLTTRINALPGVEKEHVGDPILPLLVVLQGRCHAGRRDQSGIAALIQDEVAKKHPAVLEQLASLAFDMVPNEETSDALRTLRLENVVAALTRALDARLTAEVPDIKACSILLRELIGVELSKVSATNRAYGILEKALGLMAEHQRTYPEDETRWMMATAWDTAQMLCKTGQPIEARQWGEAAKRCSRGNSRLSSYIPRIDTFLRGLSS